MQGLNIKIMLPCGNIVSLKAARFIIFIGFFVATILFRNLLHLSKLGIQDIIAIGNSDCCGHLHIVRYDVKISRIAGTSLELIHYNEIGNDKRDSLKSYKIG